MSEGERGEVYRGEKGDDASLKTLQNVLLFQRAVWLSQNTPGELWREGVREGERERGREGEGKGERLRDGEGEGEELNG